MTFADAHIALDNLFAAAPQFGEIGLVFTLHEGRVVRFERTVSEKVAQQKNIGDTVPTASGSGDVKQR